MFGQSQQQQQQPQPASTFGEFHCKWQLCHNIDDGQNMLTIVRSAGCFVYISLWLNCTVMCDRCDIDHISAS